MAVDSGYEKSRKRKRKKNKKKLLVGEHVEVLYSDEGLKGSWHSGIVIELEEGTRLVEYTNLMNEDNCSSLIESIPVSPAIEGQIVKTQKNHHGNIRPLPPHYEVQESEIKYGLCVDALVDDAWWEGVVFDQKEGSKKRLIFFPDQGDQQMVTLDRLRLTQEWNEVSGRWKPRGEWILLQVLQPFEQEEGLPVSIREIWYDLRITATFSEKIGVWTFGSRSIWHTLVSEIIQELRSVVLGVIILSSPAFSRLHPINYCPLSDSPFNERRASGSFSHVDIENVKADGSRSGLKNFHAIYDQKSVGEVCGSISSRSGLKNFHAIYDQKSVGEVCGSIIDASETCRRADYQEARHKMVDGRISGGARETWKPLDLEVSYYPEAAKICAHELWRNFISPDDKAEDVKLKARTHLLAIGWKIETRKDERMVRFYYKSPEGRSYASLYRACYALLEGQQKRKQKGRNDLIQGLSKRSKYWREDSRLDTKSNRIYTQKSQSLSKMIDSGTNKEISSSVFQECWPTNHAMLSENDLLSNDFENVSLVSDDLEPGRFPEAVLEYKRYLDLFRAEVKHVTSRDINMIRLNARKHLKFMGWKFWIKRQEANKLFITSPTGKAFQSLYSACVEYLKEENLNNNTDEASLKRAGSRIVNLSNFSESGENRSDNLVMERNGKLKRKKERCHFASFPSTSSASPSSAVENSKRKKTCQDNELSSYLSPQETQSRKRPLQRSVQTSSQRGAGTVLSLLIENDMVHLGDQVSYIRKKDGQVLKEGNIAADGIKCTCCKKIYKISNFEVHAGSTYRRPASSLFLKDGRSLLECKKQMIQYNKPKAFRRLRVKGDCSEYKSDAICTVCHDGGSLVLCDHCPSSFHLSCVGLESVPEGKWFCPSCQCRICGMSEFNYDADQFSEKTILYCDQYHVGCMRKRGDKTLSSCPVGNWFCSEKCSKIFLHLRQLLGVSQPTAVKGLQWTILRSSRENGVDNLQFDAETMTEHESKLCVALKALKECFVSITEPRTQSDLVADLLFNRESELRRLNFYGFYTMLLEKEDELVSVAVFRVYGEKVAEMPLVGTRSKFRHQGMCRLLVSELEKLLSHLAIKNLVLPAVPQLLQTWTSSFRFSKMTSSDRSSLLEHTILYFQDTIMCQKLLARAPTVSMKPEGQCKKIMDICNRSIEMDSEIDNNVSEAGHSPISTCSKPIQQEEPQPERNGLVKAPLANLMGSNVSGDMSPILALMVPNTFNSKITRKPHAYIHRDGSMTRHLTKNVNNGVENTFKYFYRRRMASNN
ncbi:uncharacterized protein LOC109829986 isoform X3 [Asparagus officinalis]|uniref:uncharacterized protein LOC109829986 isoform X3 n=1 Tax=Asparagus officinalis TaxID=4686 RepID=UPI00098DEAD5|nr:uncharacterized protein LOC109829986 isoform X3 [Asparagus officinalis]